MHTTRSGFSSSRQRLVAPIVIAAILVTSVPSPARAQAKEDFSRQLFSNVVGALMAGGALYLASLLRPDPPLQAEPRTLDFGKAQPGSEPTRTVTLTNTSKQVVVVEGMALADPFRIGGTNVPAPREVKPGERIEITVVFKPSQPQKSASGLEVRTRVGEKAKARTMKIQLKGDARGDK